jgi:hypothetical protein
MFKWGDLDPIDNFRCGMKTDGIELPAAAVEKGTDDNSCIDFDIKGVKHIFCSTE